MVRNRIIAAVISVVALVSVAGCSNATANVAATVDGYVITEQSVHAAAAGVTDILGSDPRYAGMDSMGFVLQNEIVGQLVTKTLEKMGTSISDDDRQQYWDNSFRSDMVEYGLWTDSRTKSDMAAMVDKEIVSGMMQQGIIDQNKFLEILGQLTVTVNPRYGTWDPANLAVSSRSTGEVGNPLADPSGFAMPSPSASPS